MISYAKMSLAYLTQMFELKERNERRWDMMEDESFCDTKSEEPFKRKPTITHKIFETNSGFHVE